MRKIITLALAVFLLVTGAAFTIQWFGQASKAKAEVERIIADINKSFPTISYDAITTSGFPGSLKISIIKPHYAGDMPTELMLLLQPGAPVSATPVNWHNDITLDGAIDITVNALSNRLSFATRGNWKAEYKVGEQAITLVTQAPHEMVCELQVTPPGSIFGTMWSFTAFAQNKEQALKNMRDLNCLSGAYAAYNANNELAISSGVARIYVSNQSTDSNINGRFYAKVEDSEMTEVFDRDMAALLKQLSLPYTPYALLGKQNVEIDVAVNCAKEAHTGCDINKPLDINVTKFDVKNAAYQTVSTAHISQAMQDAKRDLTFAVKSEYTAYGPSEILTRNFLRYVVDGIYASASAAHAGMRESLAKYTPDELNTILAPALPDVVSLGTVTFALDGNFKGDVNFASGELKLNNLELSTTPYGIAAQGDVKKDVTQMIPSANLNIACANCLKMIDDAVAYATRVQTTVSKLDPDAPKDIAPSPQMVAGLKTFLTTLGKQEADKLTFAIVNPGTGDITVNGKSSAEVMALFSQYVGPATAAPAAE